MRGSDFIADPDKPRSLTNIENDIFWHGVAWRFGVVVFAGVLGSENQNMPETVVVASAITTASG